MTSRNGRLTFPVLFLALLMLLPSFAATGAADSGDQSEKSESSAAEKSDKKEEKRKFSELAPDATAIPGLIPLYRKKETLYAELNSSHLDTDYIVVISIARGIGSGLLYTGQSWELGDDILWQFRKVDDRIQIVRRNYRYTAESGTPEASAVKMDYADSILYSLPILAVGPSGGDIIDLTGVFLSDLPGIASRALPGFSFARERSTWGKIKGKNDRLTDNIELEVNAAYTGGNSTSDGDPLVIDRKGVAVTIHYSISKLPTSGYNPRLADERVGYFTTAVKNMSKNQDDGNFVRYINRWNLRKLEPKAECSLPKKPIVFWLEKTIPYAYRKPIRDGILEWNQAFEEAGFYNAIEVRQQEENDDWDPEDINYNTIRWSETGLGFSIGPSRVNPLTGEILDADIVLDVGFIKSWNREFELYSPEEVALEFCGRSLASKALQQSGGDGKESFLAFDERTPLFNDRLFMSQQMGVVNTFFEVMLANAEGEETAAEQPADTEEKPAEDKPKEETASAGEKPAEEKPTEETSSEGACEEASSQETAAKEEEKSAEEKKAEFEAQRGKLIRQGLTYLTMHELGHTLGLRHNFRGSAFHTLEEVNDPEKLGKYGYSASVMDYIPTNISPKGEPQGDYYPIHLGEYDYWVIQYGYKPLKDSTDGDLEELQKIASEQSKPQYSYAEDYDCSFSSDPMVHSWDLGSDPLQYAQLRLRLFKQILPGLTDRIVHEGESYSKLAPRLNAVLNDYLLSMELALSYIGGIHFHRDFKGDENAKPPFVVVSAEEQRRAMKFLTEEVFSPEPFVLPPNLTNYLTPNLWLHWGSNPQVRHDRDLHHIFLTIQKYILWDLLDPSKLSRMADTAMRVGGEDDLFTIPEMFDSLTGAIFSELDHADGQYSARHPLISSQRRYLQREYYTQLRSMALGNPYGWDSEDSIVLLLISSGSDMRDDTASLARKQLQDIEQKISTTEGKTLDPATEAHLADLKAQITSVLQASVERSH
ncbi:MAG: zinc-dependent metalloprotease [Thermoguttaceae bacterium]|nr:zinc-dependent metalloprotease [Thermoguttaceae bacterium]